MGRNYHLANKIEERNKLASQEEKDGNLDKAIKLYEENIKEDYADEMAFERLMIIYRKQKDYEEELRVIDRGISVFRQHMDAHLRQSLGLRIDEKTLKQLSNAILKKSGLDGEDMRYPDPIDKWMKRKEVVMQKLETG